MSRTIFVFYAFSKSIIETLEIKKKNKKNFMAPFLWMGFNCLKATATSRRQFTFYHSVPRNSWFPEICEIYSKLTLICQNDIIDYILVSLVLTLEICHSCWCFFFFWYFYCLTLNEWSFAENVNYWKSLKAKRDRDMFEIKSCLRKSLVLAVWIFLSVFFFDTVYWHWSSLY